MATRFHDLAGRADLLWNLVARDLKIRYRGSILGFLWTILTPLFMAAIYLVFLRLLAGRRAAIRSEDIIIGVFAWQFTVQCVNAGLNSVTGNASLVKKVYFPRLILPLSVCLSALVNFLLTLLVQWALVIGLLLARGAAPSPALPLTLLLSLYHLAFNVSLAVLVAAANVYFRDTQHVVNLLLSAWFFLSPVMYPVELVDTLAAGHPGLVAAYRLNPMTMLLTAYRALQLPDAACPWTAAGVAGLLLPLVLLAVALAVFQRAQRYFSDLL